MKNKYKYNFLGMEMQSPFIVGSGPVSYNAQGIIRVHNAGAGAVVTKTIRDQAAINPYPHISISENNELINAEKWSDLSAEYWVREGIPVSKEAGVNVIASIGHTPVEVENWIRKVEKAGADAVELVSYSEEDLIPMIEKAKKLSSLAIIAKLSPNWVNPVRAGINAAKAGVDAITVMDSIGPALRIDIESANPLVAGEGGLGWLTGSAIRPIALAIISQLAPKIEIPIIGIGGVLRPEDGVEMLMVGAEFIGVCSVLMIKGVDYLSKINEGMFNKINSLGYQDLDAVRGAALANLPQKEVDNKFRFEYLPEECIGCKRCVELCPYQARKLSNKVMELDEDQCRYCSLCATVCPVDALNIIRG